MPDNKWVRVTDKDTGHKRSVRESALPHGNYTVLKADAVGADGEPLPPEYRAVKSTASSTTTSGHTATDKKEKSDG